MPTRKGALAAVISGVVPFFMNGSPLRAQPLARGSDARNAGPTIRPRKAALALAAAILPAATACDGSTEAVAPEPEPEGVTVTVEHSVLEVLDDDVSGILQVWFGNVTRSLQWDWCETAFERQTPNEEWSTHWSPNCTDEGFRFGPTEPIDEQGSADRSSISFTVLAPRDEFPVLGRTFRLRVALADEDGPLPEDQRISNPFDVTWIGGSTGAGR